MSDTELVPYLFFKGNAREAMEFYKGIFGGELTVQVYSEVPEMAEDKSMNDWLMHASLEGGEIKLMGSDTPKASERAAKIELSVGGSDEAKLREIFGSLSADGQIKSPLKKEFWGDTFGQLTDKYGIDWMVNITVPK